MLRNTFQNIQIGAAFWCNGNYCIKRSSRTADMYRDETRKDYFGWAYYRQNELCTNRRT